jgi:hypothetical protein
MSVLAALITWTCIAVPGAHARPMERPQPGDGAVMLVIAPELCTRSDVWLAVDRLGADSSSDVQVFSEGPAPGRCERRLDALRPGRYQALLRRMSGRTRHGAAAGSGPAIAMVEFQVRAGAATTERLEPLDATVEGRVRLAGLPPPPGTKVWAKYNGWLRTEWQTTVSANGEYRLHVQPSKTQLIVTVNPPDAIFGHAQQIVPARGSNRVDFDVPPGVVYVVLQPTYDVWEARLHLAVSHPGGAGGISIRSVSQRYAIYGKGFGRYTLRVTTPDSARVFAMAVAEISPDRPETTVTLRFRPPTSRR